MTAQSAAPNASIPAGQGTSFQRQVERISQSVVTIKAPAIDRAFDNIRSILLDWLREKAGRPLTDDMLRGESGSLDLLGAQRVETVYIASPKLWAARQDFQDETIAGRTWVTEAMLCSRDSGTLLLAFRLHCITLKGPAPFSRSVPRFMRAVNDSYNMFIDDERITRNAVSIQTPELVDRFVELMLKPSRKSPMIGISRPPGKASEKTLIDADALANGILGVGLVFVISSQASFYLTTRVGKHFSVFNGAVRIWWPGFQVDNDPYDHPLWLAARIVGDGSDRVQRTILDLVLRRSAGRRDADEAIPSFAEVRRVAATIDREKATEGAQTADQLIPLFEEENRRLEEQLKEMRADHAEMLELADDEVKATSRNLESAKVEVHALRGQVETLIKALRARDQEPDVEIPNDFDNLEAWAHLWVRDTIALLPRAINAAKKSVFENCSLAYQALLLLHEAYVPMRRSGAQLSRERWQNGLAQLGLECSPVHGGTRAGENPEDYFVAYDGRRVEIDLHLKGSNSRDPRYCFRLYFFWDANSKQVIVASLPGHLESRLS